jgi:hypothetical protein
MIELTTYRSYNMLAKYNPNVTSYDITLRDLVFIMKTARQFISS